MAHVYQNNELVDMLLIYGECLQNAAAASGIRGTFSSKIHPAPRVFINVLQRARDTGDLQEHRGGHVGRPR